MRQERPIGAPPHDLRFQLIVLEGIINLLPQRTRLGRVLQPPIVHAREPPGRRGHHFDRRQQRGIPVARSESEDRGKVGSGTRSTRHATVCGYQIGFGEQQLEARFARRESVGEVRRQGVDEERYEFVEAAGGLEFRPQQRRIVPYRVQGEALAVEYEQSHVPAVEVRECLGNVGLGVVGDDESRVVSFFVGILGCLSCCLSCCCCCCLSCCCCCYCIVSLQSAVSDIRCLLSGECQKHIVILNQYSKDSQR